MSAPKQKPASNDDLVRLAKISSHCFTHARISQNSLFLTSKFYGRKAKSCGGMYEAPPEVMMQTTKISVKAPEKQDNFLQLLHENAISAIVAFLSPQEVFQQLATLNRSWYHYVLGKEAIWTSQSLLLLAREYFSEEELRALVKQKYSGSHKRFLFESGILVANCLEQSIEEMSEPDDILVFSVPVIGPHFRCSKTVMITSTKDIGLSNTFYNVQKQFATANGCYDKKALVREVLKKPFYLPERVFYESFSVDFDEGLPLYYEFLKDIQPFLEHVYTNDLAGAVVERARSFLKQSSSLGSEEVVDDDILLGLHFLCLDSVHLMRRACSEHEEVLHIPFADLLKRRSRNVNREECWALLERCHDDVDWDFFTVNQGWDTKALFTNLYEFVHDGGVKIVVEKCKAAADATPIDKRVGIAEELSKYQHYNRCHESQFIESSVHFIGWFHLLHPHLYNIDARAHGYKDVFRHHHSFTDIGVAAKAFLEGEEEDNVAIPTYIKDNVLSFIRGSSYEERFRDRLVGFDNNDYIRFLIIISPYLNLFISGQQQEKLDLLLSRTLEFLHTCNKEGFDSVKQVDSDILLGIHFFVLDNYHFLAASKKVFGRVLDIPFCDLLKKCQDSEELWVPYTKYQFPTASSFLLSFVPMAPLLVPQEPSLPTKQIQMLLSPLLSSNVTQFLMLLEELSTIVPEHTCSSYGSYVMFSLSYFARFRQGDFTKLSLRDKMWHFYHLLHPRRYEWDCKHLGKVETKSSLNLEDYANTESWIPFYQKTLEIWRNIHHL